MLAILKGMSIVLLVVYISHYTRAVQQDVGGQITYYFHHCSIESSRRRVLAILCERIPCRHLILDLVVGGESLT